MNQAKERRDQYLAYRKSIYQDFPQVEKFENRKRKWLGFLIVYSLSVFIAKAVMLRILTHASVFALILGVFMGFGMNLIFLAAAMGPKWKIALALYFWFLYQSVNFVSGLARNGINSWGGFLQVCAAGFQVQPLVMVFDILGWVLALLELLTAMWLTLIPRNRELADQSDKLNEQFKEFMSSHPMEPGKQQDIGDRKGRG